MSRAEAGGLRMLGWVEETGKGTLWPARGRGGGLIGLVICEGRCTGV